MGDFEGAAVGALVGDISTNEGYSTAALAKSAPPYAFNIRRNTPLLTALDRVFCRASTDGVTVRFFTTTR